MKVAFTLFLNKEIFETKWMKAEPKNAQSTPRIAYSTY